MKTTYVIGAALLAAAVLPAVAQQPPAPPAPPASPAPRARGRVMAMQGSATYLGIGVQDMDAERARALKLKEDRGAEVTSVTADSPASKAGIKEGDVVLEYNGQPVEGQEQLARLVRETPAGRQVKVVVWRNGSAQTLSATVEARRGGMFEGGDFNFTMPNITIPPMPPMDIPNIYMGGRSAMLGIEGENISRESQLGEFFGVKEGVLVKAVTKNSAAEKAGIRAGDVIVRVDEERVSSTREITAALRDARSKKTFNVVVVRNKKETPLSVTIEDNAPGRPPRRAMLMNLPV
jgi:serine protease Do